MPSFLTLDDLLLWPPLASMLSVLVVAGIWWAGDHIAQAIWRSPEPVERAAGFVISAATLAVLVNALTLLHLVSLPLLRLIAALLAMAGARQIYLLLRPPYPFVGAALGGNGRLERLSLVLCAITTAALFLAALGPVTDADSLDYHLGVPLDWLRHGGAYPRDDWLHARLVGIGEAINLLGLGAGTDNLGAVVQFSGLIVVWTAVLSLASDSRARVLGSLLVLTCPLLMFLVPNQKPQLFPAAALMLGLVLLVSERPLTRRTTAVAFVCVAYAMANKYSFLLSGSVVLVYGLLRCRQRAALRFALGALAISLSLIVVPNLLRNVYFYGDPVSPLLERFFVEAEDHVVRFSDYLRNIGGGVSLARLMALPLEWIFSPNLLVGSNVLGIGMLAFLTITRADRPSKALLGCAAMMLVLVLLLCQLSARFAFESYLAIAGAAVASAWNPRKRVFQYALVAQGAVVATMAVYTAVVLFPGALSDSERHRVMGKTALHYDATRWLDSVLPQRAMLLSPLRVNALLPRPFRSYDERVFLSPDDHRERLRRLSRAAETLVWVEDAEWYERGRSLYARCVSRVIAGPKRFDYASRNPLARRNYEATDWIVLELQLDAAPCDVSRHRDPGGSASAVPVRAQLGAAMHARQPPASPSRSGRTAAYVPAIGAQLDGTGARQYQQQRHQHVHYRYPAQHEHHARRQQDGEAARAP